MRKNKVEHSSQSELQKTAESLADKATTAAMKIAAESANRAKLAKNALSQEETPCVYKKVF